MVRIIMGEKGAGKTKTLIRLVNDAVNTVDGNVVCIEKANVLTFDIDPRARLISVSDYIIKGYEGLMGFICGIMAENYDVTDMFVDSILRIGGDDIEKLSAFVEEVAALSERNSVNITITVSKDPEYATQAMKKYLM